MYNYAQFKFPAVLKQYEFRRENKALDWGCNLSFFLESLEGKTI